MIASHKTQMPSIERQTPKQAKQKEIGGTYQRNTIDHQRSSSIGSQPFTPSKNWEPNDIKQSTTYGRKVRRDLFQDKPEQD